MTPLARISTGFKVALMFGIAVFAASPAIAQDSQHIAAVVNDEIISAYDLEQRLSLAIASSGAPDTPEQRANARAAVLRGLIDEKLQMQAAKSKGVEIPDSDVADAIGRIAQGNNVPIDQFDDFLSKAGVVRATLENQIRVQLAWQKLIGKELGPRISVGGDAVEATMERLKASVGKPEMLISEIFLPVDTSVDEPQVRALADKIVQDVKTGTPFRLLARQYSQAPTAATGGDLGWVAQGQLPEEVEAAASKMQNNTLSDPIRANGGYYIIGLRDKRQLSGLDPSQVKLDLKQVIVPVAAATGGGEGEGAARATAAEIRGCDNLEDIAKRHGGTVRDDPGRVTLADVTGVYRNAVEPLSAGQAAAPIKSGNGYQIVVVCSRENPASLGPSRETVTDELEQAQLNMLARRYLRDLRRDATIETR